MLQVNVDSRNTRTLRALELIERVRVGETFHASLIRSRIPKATATAYIGRLLDLKIITPVGATGHYRRNAAEVEVRHDPLYGKRKSQEMQRARARRECVLEEEWTSARIAAVAPALCHVFGLTELPRGPFREPRRVVQRD